jgi:putative protein kinase ArgK-like GTPase of G3E family
MELADIIVLNKCDLFKNCELYSKEISQALSISKTLSETWETPIILNSCFSDESIYNIIHVSNQFFYKSISSGTFFGRRKNQLMHNFNETLNIEFIQRLNSNKLFQKNKENALKSIESGKMNFEQGLDICLNFLF